MSDAPAGRPPRHPSDHYLASILAQASDAILSTDADDRVLSWNAAAESLLGYPAEAVVGEPLALLDPEPERLDPGLSTLGILARRVRERRHTEWADVACRHPNGSLVYVEASLAPVRDAEGRLLGLSVIARDVSERRSMEEALRDANRQKDEFLTVMSHELRTPLTTVLGYTDMLLRGIGGPLAPRMGTYLGAVRAAGDRLLELVNGLLEYSRLEAGAERLRLRPVALDRVVDRALERIRPLALGKGLHLECALASDLGPVVGDEEKLLQILGNFLANAVKFTVSGGTVRVEASRDPLASHMARLAVRDTGVGMSREQIGRVWESFYQGDSSLTRRHGGIGLGLAIARHLAALHGGRVWAESAGPGRGSTFWLTLPLSDA